MTLVDALLQRARHLAPGSFALVMASGIVSIDAGQYALPRVARALLAFNLLAFGWLLALSMLCLARFRRDLMADFVHPGRGAGFLTFAAATCVLGSQCLLVVHWPWAVRGLAVAGALGWALLTYLFLAAAITARIKPGFIRSIHGGWLVAVVATQALAMLLTLLGADAPPAQQLLLFGARACTCSGRRCTC